MDVFYATTGDAGRWNACLHGFKIIDEFLFAMIAFLKIILPLFIWLVLLPFSKPTYEMSPSNITASKYRYFFVLL